MSDYFTQVGDCINGAGTPTPGEPYVIPTVDAEGRMCDMQVGDIEMTDPTHYRGVVKSITPVADQDAWDIWGKYRARRRWRLLCRVGLHSWVTTIGNYPGEDRWYRTTECARCGSIDETDDPKDKIGTGRSW